MNNSYEEIPYVSQTYQETDPARISAIATLMGARSQSLPGARVLEFGCGDATNLCALAAHYPTTEFVGIDISEGHIENGLKTIKDHNLNNIDLLRMSFVDFENKKSPFDYIIVHGLYSWVPEATRQKLMQICKDLLSNDGLLYISYNVLPGWNSAKTIRDMMIFHGTNFTNPQEKILEARRMLNFVNDNVQATEFYSQMLKEEIDYLVNQPDTYLYHEYMEAVNTPCYFKEFVESAKNNGLEYLSDCDLPIMYLGNYSLQAQDTLKKITDPIEVEQYLDFLANRRFRMSVLCHTGQNIERNITGDRLVNLGFISRVVEEQNQQNYNINRSLPAKFISNKGLKVSIKSLVLASVLRVMEGCPNYPLTVDEIVELTRQEYNEFNISSVKSEILGEFPQLILQDVIGATTIHSRQKLSISTCSKVWPYAVKTAGYSDTVSNLQHSRVHLDDASRILINLMDGNHTFEEILEKYTEYYLDGTITFKDNEKNFDNEKGIKNELSKRLKTLQMELSKQALLVE